MLINLLICSLICSDRAFFGVIITAQVKLTQNKSPKLGSNCTCVLLEAKMDERQLFDDLKPKLFVTTNKDLPGAELLNQKPNNKDEYHIEVSLLAKRNTT